MAALLDVDKLVRFSSSSLGADKLYKALGYALDATAHVVAPATPRETSQGMHALASSVSMARYVMRLTGGLEAYAALKKGSWCHDDDDELVQRLVRLQALSMVVYHPLEHVSYVGFVAPALVPVDALHVSRLSCRAWGVYILLDMYANVLRLRALTAKKKQILAMQKLTENERSASLARIHDRCRELYYVQLRNVLYAGPCMHWSFEKRLFSDRLVSFLCAAEAAIGLWRAWVNAQ